MNHSVHLAARSMIVWHSFLMECSVMQGAVLDKGSLKRFLPYLYTGLKHSLQVFYCCLICFYVRTMLLDTQRWHPSHHMVSWAEAGLPMCKVQASLRRALSQSVKQAVLTTWCDRTWAAEASTCCGRSSIQTRCDSSSALLHLRWKVNTLCV